LIKGVPLQEQCVITRSIRVACGVFAPGHLGELTQILDFALVDAVLTETGRLQRRIRLLPSRVVVYFVLALALFEACSYRAVWEKLVAGLAGLPLVRPHTSSLARARRRIGAAPFKALFATVAGPVAWRDTPGATWCGLRTVAIDATVLHIPDSQAIGCRYPKRHGETLEFGYPLLRLVTVIETGTRAILAAAFGPESHGELSYAQRLLGTLGARMLVLLDAGFDAWEFLRDVQVTRAQFLVRSSARRCPTILRRFPDGSYLTRLG
jgi:Insertion element 4 transposase N-terminal